MRRNIVLFVLVTAALGLATAAYAKGKRGKQAAKPRTGSGFTVQVGMSQGRLGAQVMDLTDDLRDFFGAPKDAGILVSKVTPDSPAAKAGVRVGDVIVEVAGQPIDGPWQVITALADKNQGDQVSVVVIRAKKRVKLSATLDDSGLVGRALRLGKGGHFDVDLGDLGDLDVDLGGLADLGQLGGDLDALLGKHGITLGHDSQLRQRLDQANKRLEEVEKRLRALEKKQK